MNRILLLAILTASLSSAVTAQSGSFQNTRYTVDTTGRVRVAADVHSSAAASTGAVASLVSAEQQAFRLLNDKRAANGLGPLVWSDQVAVIARLHSQNMASLSFFSHRGLDDKMVSDRADEHGLGKWHAIGENIAFNRGYSDPVGKAVDQWLNSPSHLHNLMAGNWKESAVGIAIAADGSYYFTQVFLKR